MEDESRFIVITGATRGIGRALVNELAEGHHRVAGCGRSQDQTSQLQQSPGPAENFSVVDVTDAAAVESWATGLIERHGAPDLLIANAGMMNIHAPAWEISAELWEEMIRINVLGVANTIRAFVPHMVAQGRGTIIAFSSGTGLHGFPNIAPYCTSKHAVEGMMKSLAKDLPEGMAAIPLQPGTIDTDILRSHWGEKRSSAEPSPAEWARHAVPHLLQLGPEHSGQSIRLPQPGTQR